MKLAQKILPLVAMVFLYGLNASADELYRYADIYSEIHRLGLAELGGSDYYAHSEWHKEALTLQLKSPKGVLTLYHVGDKQTVGFPIPKERYVKLIFPGLSPPNPEYYSFKKLDDQEKSPAARRDVFKYHSDPAEKFLKDFADTKSEETLGWSEIEPLMISDLKARLQAYVKDFESAKKGDDPVSKYIYYKHVFDEAMRFENPDLKEAVKVDRAALETEFKRRYPRSTIKSEPDKPASDKSADSPKTDDKQTEGN